MTQTSRLLSLLIACSFGFALPLAASLVPAQAQIEPQSGQSVAEIQQRLANLGYYDGPVTGYLDTSTQAAVSRFQQANGLAADGIVGAATSGALGISTTTATSQPNGLPSGLPSEASSETTSGFAQLNDSSSQVSEVQQQLSQLGYYTGSVTGVFDDATQAAVISFQRSRGLAADGIVGNATMSALTEQAPASAAPSPTYTPVEASNSDDSLLQLGDSGTEVSTLQTQLQSMGYYDGPISGSFGSQTQTALIAFQQAQGLTADGIAGPRVSAALSGSSQPAAQPAAPATPTVATAATAATATQPILQPAVQPAAQPAVQPTTVQPTTQPAASVMPSVAPVTPIQGSVQVPALPPAIPAAPTGEEMAQMPSSMPSSPSSAQPNSDRQRAYRTPSMSRFSVTELQRRLQMRGFDPGDTSGVYDSATQGAINQAQQAYGLSGEDLFD